MKGFAETKPLALAGLVCAFAVLSGQTFHFVYPAHPVSVQLDVGKTAILGTLENNSVLWEEIVLGGRGLSPGPWDAEAISGVEAHLNQSLRLEVDGRVIPAELRRSSFWENPWDIRGGRIRLEFVYPLPDGAKTLRVGALFFETYRRFMARRPDFEESFADGYATFLSFKGTSIVNELRAGEHSVSFDFDRLRPSRGSVWGGDLVEGFKRPWGSGAFLLFLVAGFLARPKREDPLGSIAVFTGGLIGGFFFLKAVPAWESAIWVPALVMCFGIYSEWKRPFWLAAAGLGGLFWGGMFDGFMALARPSAEFAPSPVFYFLGFGAAIDVLLAGLIWGARAHRLSVERFSRELADRFERRRYRLAAAVISGVSLVSMVQAWGG